MQVDRLVFQVVILETQGVTGVHVDQLAHVAVGLRPVQLVPPRLVDTRDLGAHTHNRYSPPWDRVPSHAPCDFWLTPARPGSRQPDRDHDDPTFNRSSVAPTSRSISSAVG